MRQEAWSGGAATGAEQSAFSLDVPMAPAGVDGSRELIIDSFAGGGGASVGIERALGRSPDYAINHDAAALAMHRANHPDTVHLSRNIWRVDPMEVVGLRPVGLLWASPDCKHHSKAKGGRPAKREIRDLAWTVVLWARRARPRVIILENVEEFRDWGPLVQRECGRFYPDPERRGQTFDRWVGELKRLGYRVQWRELRACDFGTPTIRKRLFLIARRDGKPIVWPKPTHGPPDDPDVIAGQQEARTAEGGTGKHKRPWRTAAEIIDWSLPCPSIFDDAATIKARYGVRAVRPLAEATLRRVAKGVARYVLEAERPFIVPAAQGRVAPFVSYGQQGGANRPIDAPVHTVTASAKDTNSVIAPYLVPRYGERPGQRPRTRSIDVPHPVVVPTGNGASLVAAFLAQHNTDMVGHGASEPVSTIVGKGCTQGLVATRMVGMGGDAGAAPVLSAAAEGHAGSVAAFLTKYYGQGDGAVVDAPMHTDTTRDRFGLVTVTIDGETFVIVDIGMRMLTPRERFRAQGFPDSYRIEAGVGPDRATVPLTQEVQGRCCGNSVCPPLAEALVRANCADMAIGARAGEAVA